MAEGILGAKYPHPESLEAVKRALGVNNAVSGYAEIVPQVYEIFRTGRSDVMLYVTQHLHRRHGRRAGNPGRKPLRYVHPHC